MKNDDYREKAFHNEFCEFDNFNSNEIFFTPSSYSLMHLNQDNKNDIHNEINTKMNISQLNPYYSSNNNQTNFSSPELLKPLMPFIQFNQNDINFYPSTDYQFNNTNSNFNTNFEFNLFNTPPSNNIITNIDIQMNYSPLISKIMLQFRDKLYPLLKKFFMNFAQKLINDEPIQIAVIDLEKTSIFDYDLGCYSLPTDTEKFKYKVYNLFDNLKSITRILKLALIIYNKINLLMPCTKRELYYENVDLFRSTDIIDNIESDLCSILGICRFDLPIFPSAKGLFCGNITLVNKFGNKLNINTTDMNNKINLINYEYLIDDFYLDDNTKKNINLVQNDININIDGENSNLCNKYFVLIVEKETLFFNLVGNFQFYKKFPNAIIITGKGYPDYITKIFIKKLSNQLNNVPFIYFGDYDPHGLEIYLNYLFGSCQSCKENIYMCMGNIKWIGLFHENIETILKFNLINKEIMNDMNDNGEKDIMINDKDNQESQSGLIQLNSKDKIKIKNLLKKEYFNNDEKWIKSNNPNNEKLLTNLTIIKNELIQMENSEYKAEGEYLVSRYFSDFLYLVEKSII